jgi:lactoylglutathione lyase
VVHCGPFGTGSLCALRRKGVKLPKIIHSMFRVHGLDKALKFYEDALELKTSHRLDFPDFSLVYLKNTENDVEIELTWNKGRDVAYTHGDGYGHIAVAVPNLEEEHARMSGLGLNPLPIKEFKHGEEMLARFFFLQDPDGYKIEVLERAGHYV